MHHQSFGNILDSTRMILIKKIVKCKLCKKTVASSQGNTTNLFHHLQHNHVIQFEDIKKAQSEKRLGGPAKTSSSTRQRSITEAFTSTQLYERTSKRWQEITNAIGYHIAKDMAPIATVERNGFRHFMKIIDKRYELPSRKYFSKTIIPSMYSTEREKVAAELRYVKHVAATSDLWSSRTMEPYISLTVHYIDNKWELRTRVLETAYFPSDHMGEMVGQGLRAMLSAWDISEEDLVAITTDNGPNIVKAVKLNKWTRVQCFGHRLHLAIENTLKNHPPVERATKTCKKIVSTFAYSWKKKKALRKAQQDMNLPMHKLKTACPTRWGSMQMMTARILEQKNAITRVLTDDRASRHLVPTWPDLDVLEAVNKALAPLVEFTDVLSGEEYVTISSVKPVLHILHSRVLAEEEDDVTLTKTIKSEILAYLDDKFSDPPTVELLDTASFVDPRFKAAYISADCVTTIQEKVKMEMKSAAAVHPESTAESTEPQPSTSSEEKKRKRSLGRFFKESETLSSTAPTVSPEQAIEAELSSYSVCPVQDSEENPLDWWRKHQVNFPTLSKVAKKYLCIPATSSPSERVFSSGGNIVTCLRSCLKPDMVNMLVFLSKNLE
ncbi:zinc finger BED domain-containing protein 1-like [Oreochromis niloticus]|uniref:zinc finger BED domain-containing protein 1-like n=1 Tax=Oreochromis niloticus TaxID=8128 RepID=UPI000DF3D1B3|nr:zinc finger BED domain-containing protein 1-like [Oreochromis niloticus]